MTEIPPPASIEEVLHSLEERRAFYRDRVASKADILFEGPAQAPRMRLPDSELRIALPVIRRLARHFGAPYPYLAKYPVSGELTEHLTVLTHARKGRRIIRAIDGPEGKWLRGLMRPSRSILDTGAVLTFNRSILEALPGYGGLRTLSLPALDGSDNRAIVSVPIAARLCQEPQVQALLEIVNDECGDVRVIIGVAELNGTRTGRIASLTRVAGKAGSTLEALRRTRRAIQKVMKGVPMVQEAFRATNARYPLGACETARILDATRTFPPGFAQAVSLRADDEFATVPGAFLTLLDTARGLPATLRRDCEKRAWALLLTGFRSLLAFEKRGPKPQHIVQL